MLKHVRNKNWQVVMWEKIHHSKKEKLLVYRLNPYWHCANLMLWVFHLFVWRRPQSKSSKPFKVLLWCCRRVTNHHCFCTWRCKFSCSILDEVCEIVLQELLLKLNPVPSVKGDSFNRHSFFGVNNKIAPSSTSTAHLALNLGVVRMISFQFAHVSDPLTKEFGIRTGI